MRLPTNRVTALGQQRQETVAQQAGQRHGHAQFFRSGEGQVNILVAQWCGKSGWFKFLIGDQSAVGFIDWCTEKC